MESIQRKNISQLNLLNESIKEISDEIYSKPISLLSGASIGKHVRHVCEFYNILINSFAGQTVNYDNRNRQEDIESEVFCASQLIEDIIIWLEELEEDCQLFISQNGSNEKFYSSLFRELQYVFEHTTHHMAIIKIGFKEVFPAHKLANSFGVAVSTLKFQNS